PTSEQPARAPTQQTAVGNAFPALHFLAKTSRQRGALPIRHDLIRRPTGGAKPQRPAHFPMVSAVLRPIGGPFTAWPGARGKVLSRRHPPSRPPNSPLERRRRKQPSETPFQSTRFCHRLAAGAAIWPSGTTSSSDPLAGHRHRFRPIFRWSAPSIDPQIGRAHV